jgi:hypothetical protein
MLSPYEPSGRPSRTRSRRCCPAGVYPPLRAYRMTRLQDNNRRTPRPDHYEFNLVSTR